MAFSMSALLHAKLLNNTLSGVILDFKRDPPMSSLQEFRCEICGRITNNPDHWFVIQCSDAELTVLKWNSQAANAAGARHFCGEAHAQVYISRWFESICSPPKPDFTRSASVKS